MMRRLFVVFGLTVAMAGAASASTISESCGAGGSVHFPGTPSINGSFSCPTNIIDQLFSLSSPYITITNVSLQIGAGFADGVPSSTIPDTIVFTFDLSNWAPATQYIDTVSGQAASGTVQPST